MTLRLSLDFECVSPWSGLGASSLGLGKERWLFSEENAADRSFWEEWEKGGPF